MSDIDQLLKGSIDTHVHHGPDSFMVRRVDALEAARQAQQVGMRAIVLKSHHYPTTPLAITVSQLVPGIDVFGSICLDFEVGGLNFYALEASAKLGAKVVWMPTSSAANSRAKMSSLGGVPMEGDGFSILDSSGRLVPEMGRILSLVKEHDMVLASGHISPAETFALVEEALKTGIRKLIITHPSEAEVMEKLPSLKEQQQLAEMGAFIEYTCNALLPTSFGHNPAHAVEAIKAIGAKQCIISTDLGQFQNPPPAEGMRIFIAILLKYGIKEEEIDLVARANPAKLLNLY
ncbi:DUF6282 family protein [Chloroflexota bacterium]